jgi:hypothetical protein
MNVHAHRTAFLFEKRRGRTGPAMAIVEGDSPVDYGADLALIVVAFGQTNIR